MEIHQILVSASPGDPATNSAFEIRNLLRRSGPSELFARYVDNHLAGEVFHVEDYPKRPSALRGQDLLVYQASMGDPGVLSFLLGRPERLVLVYHNVTAARYVARIDPRLAKLLADSRAELAALRDRVDLALATSVHNAAELEALGYSGVRVSPLVMDVESLTALRPHRQTTAHLAEYLQGPLVLFVGPLLPHQRLDLLLQAYHILVTYILPEAYLAVVGPSPASTYRYVIDSYVRELSLTQAWLPGRLGRAELAAFFRAASVFVTLSEYEGVCVPSLEAMAFEIPVLARRSACVSETLADAGLILPAEDDAFLIAEALARLLTDEVLRKELVTSGAKRLASFDPESAGATFLAHLSDVT